jgi:L-cysteine S-thiosulfotransferase
MRAAELRIVVMAVVCAAALGACLASAQDHKALRPKDKDNPLQEMISGYSFTPLKVRALQDDDFDNPGFAWLNRGEKMWGEVDGTAQKSCASCHANPGETLRNAGATYPKYQDEAKAVINLEQRINLCRQAQMQASPWPYESEALLDMTTYVKSLARGVPVDVKTDGPAREAFALGGKLYNSRVGQLGMSCAHCHNDHYGKFYRTELLSQGHTNGFPAYQMKSRSVVSLHQRFRSCYLDIRAEPYELGSPEFVALELYLAWRGKGLPVETPAVRR